MELQRLSIGFPFYAIELRGITIVFEDGGEICDALFEKGNYFLDLEDARLAESRINRIFDRNKKGKKL